MFGIKYDNHHWIRYILALVIIVSFLIVGFQGYENLSNGRGMKLVDISNYPIFYSEFEQSYNNIIDQIRYDMDDKFDHSEMNMKNIRKKLLDRIINEHVLSLMASDYHISISDERLKKTIISLDWGNGKDNFSSDAYLSFLRKHGITPKEFESYKRNQLLIQQVLDPIIFSEHIPNTITNTYAETELQKRSIRIRTYLGKDFDKNISIKTQDILLWYENNKAHLKIPESVDIDYIILDKNSKLENINIQEEDIINYYNMHCEDFFVPEERSFSQIFIKYPDIPNSKENHLIHHKAEFLVKQAQKYPDIFSDLARENSQDLNSALSGGFLGKWQAQELLEKLGQNVQESVFNLNEGQISELINGPEGFHILKLIHIKPSSALPLNDSIKEKIRTQIYQEMIADHFIKKNHQLLKLLSDQKISLDFIANILGLKIHNFKGLTYSGNLLSENSDSIYDQFLNSKLIRQTIFSKEVLNERRNFIVLEISPSILIVFRIAQIKPEFIPNLKEIEDIIRSKLLTQYSTYAAIKKGEEDLKALQADMKNSSFEYFSEEFEISRIKIYEEIPKMILDVAMNVPSNLLPVFIGFPIGQNFFIVYVKDIITKNDQNKFGDYLSSVLGESEEKALLNKIRKKYNVKPLPILKNILEKEF